MNTDQESLLSAPDRSQTFGGLSIKSNGNNPRWRKNLFLLLVVFSIAICLTIYIYLNLVAINGNQIEPASYKPLSRRKPMLDHESIFADSGPSMIKLNDLMAHCIVALRIAGQEVVNLSLAHNDKLIDVRSKGKTLEGADDVVTGADMKSHKIIRNTIKDSYRRLKVVSEEDSTSLYENTVAENDILPIERTKFAQLLRDDLHEIEKQHVGKGSLIAQHETLVWIDPLDATKEYSENLTEYVTLMACIVHKGTPIAGVIFKPFANQTYWSIEDISTGEHHWSPDLYREVTKAASKQSEKMRVIVSRSHAGDVKEVLTKAYGEKVDIISAGGSGFKTIELVGGKVDAYMHLTHIKKWDVCAPSAIINSLNGNLTDLRRDKITFGDPKDKVITQGLLASRNPKIYEELLRLTKNFKSSK